MLRDICFIKEGQRYPDHFRIRTRSTAAAMLFPDWDADLAAALAGRLRPAGQAAGQEALPRHELGGRHRHRPRLPGAAHPVRRAVPGSGRRRAAAVLRPADRRLRRAPAHRRPLDAPHRGDRRPARARAADRPRPGAARRRRRVPPRQRPHRDRPGRRGAVLRRGSTSSCTPSPSAATAGPSSGSAGAADRHAAAPHGPHGRADQPAAARRRDEPAAPPRARCPPPASDDLEEVS